MFSTKFNCEFCSKFFVKPVALPCGSTICQSHIDEVLTDTCLFCKGVHITPEGGFKVNDVLQKVVDIQVNSILSNPIFIDCKQCMEAVKSTVEAIDVIKNYPETYIAEYFERIKHQWDERSDDINIDIYMENLQAEMLELQEKCKLETKESIKFRTGVDACKEESNVLISRFETLMGYIVNIKKYDEIKDKGDVLLERLTILLDDYKKVLIGEKGFSDSKILTRKNAIDLMSLCEFSHEQHWKLIYRACLDGFHSKDFHNKCDGVADTLTVIKSANNNVFGGYTAAPWNSVGKFVMDKEAFIFSLINKENRMLKVKATEGLHLKNAIYGSSNWYGPAFGYCDLFIHSDSNTNEESSSDLGLTYKHPDYRYKTIRAQSILAGSRMFKTKEIEVYRKEV